MGAPEKKKKKKNAGRPLVSLRVPFGLQLIAWIAKPLFQECLKHLSQSCFAPGSHGKSRHQSPSRPLPFFLREQTMALHSLVETQNIISLVSVGAIALEFLTTHKWLSWSSTPALSCFWKTPCTSLHHHCRQVSYYLGIWFSLVFLGTFSLLR